VGWAHGPRVGLRRMGAPEILSPLEVFCSGCVYMYLYKIYINKTRHDKKKKKNDTHNI